MNDDDVLYGRVPFDEAIRFFEGKRLVGTKRWNDLWQEQHDVAFMVAGVARGDLLQGLRDAVRKGIEEGTTLQTFRKDFDALVAAHGWPWADRPDTKAYRAWRTDVIYQTNLSSAYAAGRFEQMSDPDVTARRPYWRYRHSGAANPREQHKAWNGLVLRHDDPFWQTHYPPNGWGCGCHVVTLSEDDLKRLGKTAPDPSPEVATQPWTDAKTGLTYDVPEGISPGFGYAPGRLKQNETAARTLAERMLRFDWDIGAAVWNETQQHAVAYLTTDFAEWADGVLASSGRARGEMRVVGALSQATVEAMKSRSLTPATAALTIDEGQLLHMRRDAKLARGQGVAEEVLRHLPRALTQARAVLLDLVDSALLYVFDAPDDVRMAKLVVRFDFRQKTRTPKGRQHVVSNSLRSTGLVQLADLANGSRYAVIEGTL